MQDQLASLRGSLSQSFKTEAQVVHFLVDVRSVLELSGGFKKLKFFCSWPLHPQMSYPPVREIMKWLDELMEGAELNPWKALELMRTAYPFTSLREFAEELHRFLLQHQLDTSLVQNANRWVPFLGLYVVRIERTPLIDSSGSFKCLDEVRIKRLDKPSTQQRPTDRFVFGIEWFFMHRGVRRLPIVNDVLF